jgi:hypothetical protein
LASQVVGLVAIVLVASCGPRPPAEEPQEPMPSAVLDKQDPTAHYEHHPSGKLVGGGGGWHWPHLFGGGAPDPFYGPSEPPHYYTGCGGCSSDDPANVLVVFAIAPIVLRRRRR